MKDEQWIRGMSELAASFPDRDLPEQVLAVRGDVYRRELDHLDGDRWLFAVREAIRNERWFPTVAALLEYAESAGAPPVAGLLPPPRRTEEEKERDRQAARAAIEEIRRIVGNVPPPAKRFPAKVDADRPIEDTNERRDLLKRQAQEIQAPAEEPAGGVKA